MTEHDPLHSDYISRINKTFDYIEKHLGEPMTLEELAQVAHFSKYHFNRIFHSIVGETPFQFIQRVRIEKAAMMISTRKGESISAIAQQCGITDISVFSRNFRHYFKMSASAYRSKKRDNSHSGGEATNSGQQVSNSSQQVSNSGQSDKRSVPYFCPELQTIKWRTNMKLNQSVEVKEFPKMTVAYIRHTGPYQGDDKLFEGIWNRLFAWAGPRGLIGGKDFRSLVIYHDDPNVTIGDKLRMSVCITVPEDTKVDGEIGKMEIPRARYMIARFVLTAQDFQEAWDWVYGQWFPTSGYQPDDKPCFEMYPEEPKDGKFTVDICIPVKSM